MAKDKAFDYMQVPLALVATDLISASIEVEGAYFRLARVLGVNGPMPISEVRELIGDQPRIERLLDHRSTDAEPLLSFGWVEEWRARARASRERLSAAGKVSAEKRSKKKAKRNTRSTDVQQQSNNSSTNVEHATILSSTLNEEESSGKKERAKTEPVDPLPFPSPEFALAVGRWERHRAEIKHELTHEARKAWLRKCDTLGEARAIAAIDHSIANGWQGMFEPKVDSARPVPPSPSGSFPPMDRNAPVGSKLFKTYAEKMAPQKHDA